MLITNKDNDTRFTFLHPVHGILLSYFTGAYSFGKIAEEIENELGIKYKDLVHFLSSFLENKNMNIKYDNFYFSIPPFVLVKNRRNITRLDIDRKSFLIYPPFNFSTIRLNIPRSILFVINTKCCTDCTYCYADRATKYISLSTERILRIIEDAKAIGVNVFDITGGELFLHKDWEIILDKMYECGYSPFISTKIPLSEDTIDRLIEKGVSAIQISLDSIDEDLQAENTRCHRTYVCKITECIEKLNSRNIDIHIKSTLTKNTCTIRNVAQLLNFINPLNRVKSFSLTAVGFSQYLSVDHYKNIKPSLSQLREVKDFIKNNKRKNIIFDCDFRGVHYKSEYKNKNEFDKRDLCTGNISGFVLLPDGKVTICEGLYWTENFIIGDLTHNCIMDVWNSPKALSLFKLKKESISSDSACKQCDVFDKCRCKLGVCWKNVIFYHGKECWDYPDPMCPNSPIVEKSIEILSYEEI